MLETKLWICVKCSRKLRFCL